MSLINDALKRAKHAQQKSPPPPSPGPLLRPVEPVRRKQSDLGILLPIALVVLVGLAGLIIWFAMRTNGARPSPTAVAQVKPVSASAATSPKPTPTTNLTPPLAATKPAPAAPAQAAPRRPETKVATAPPIARPPQPKSKPAPISAPRPASTQAQAATPQPITVPTATATTETVTQPVVVVSKPPPLPKLQGIFYRPKRPAALLNGKMVLIGDTSGEYRVVAISQQSVTIVRTGQTNVLNMPD